jgi:hypothetical protein
VIVSDLLTKKFTIRITKKSNGTKMNPYQPPRNENPVKVCLKSVAISFIATIAMVIAILVYFFVVGSVVRWLN